MSKRVSKVIGKPITTDQVEKVLGAYSELDADRDGLINAMEVEIVKIRQKYEGKIQAISDEMEEKREQLQYFAEVHRDDEFDKKNRRSISTVHGEIGFRLGQMKVTQLRGWKVNESVTALKDHELNGFLRTKEEIDKQHIIDYCKDTDKCKELTASLKMCGLKIEQDETFFVKTKKEELAEV
jgi:phage host-nuclease inhibitor protein Gam